MFHYFGSGQNRRESSVLGGFVLTLLQLAWILGMGLSPVSECSRRRSASKSINQARARAGARSLLLILTHKTSGRPNLVQCMLAGWLAGGCTWMERWAVIFACVLYIAGFFFFFSSCFWVVATRVSWSSSQLWVLLPSHTNNSPVPQLFYLGSWETTTAITWQIKRSIWKLIYEASNSSF